MQKMSIDSPYTMDTSHVQDIRLRCRSLSVVGTVTSDSDLIAQDPYIPDVVIAHEHLHLRVPVHGCLCNARMSGYVWGWRELTEQRSSGPSGGGTSGQ